MAQKIVGLASDFMIVWHPSTLQEASHHSPDRWTIDEVTRSIVMVFRDKVSSKETLRVFPFDYILWYEVKKRDLVE